MQIYKRMDIGTAKPTREEQAKIPHHMIDIVEPHEEYTISQFQIEAQNAIEKLRAGECYLYLSGHRTVLKNNY